MYGSQASAALCLVFFAQLMSLVDARRQVLSTVIYTNHGERTPSYPNVGSTLTSWGASQLYTAGSRMRDRYIAFPPNGTNRDAYLRDVSRDSINNAQLYIRSTTDPWVVGSAQAFVQGLYPPAAPGGDLSNIGPSSFLANRTYWPGPLDGYQYPQIVTTPWNHVSSIWLDGTRNCPTWERFKMQVLASAMFQDIQKSNQSFYDELYTKYLSDIFEPSQIGFPVADLVYEYLQYADTHNATVAETLDPVDLIKARVLAADLTSFVTGQPDTTSTDHGQRLLALAGRTFANRVVAALNLTATYDGTVNLINLLFGDSTPMSSFAALADLPFNAPPAPGSSFIFELYSLTMDSSDAYPDRSDIHVRFLYVNGTDNNSHPVEYYLFGASPSSHLPLQDFIKQMEDIQIPDAQTWCSLCQSDYTFCQAYDALEAHALSNERHHPISAAIGGLIGALVTLVVLSLTLAAIYILGGIRLHRTDRKRRSNLGGFKGTEKLASDLDLTVSKGGAGAVVVETGSEGLKTHERVGSWELREQAKAKDLQLNNPGLNMQGAIARRPSYEDDEIHVTPFATPVTVRDSL